MAKKELKEQLKSYEGYINDIPLVIDPCRNVRTLNARTKNRLKNVGSVVGIIQVVLKWK